MASSKQIDQFLIYCYLYKNKQKSRAKLELKKLNQ